MLLAVVFILTYPHMNGFRMNILRFRRFRIALLVTIICVLSLTVALIRTSRKQRGVSRTAIGASPEMTATLPSQILAGTFPPSQVPPEVRAQVAETYGKLPLSFEANRGQSDKEVKFLSRGHGYTLFLTRDEAVLSLRQSGIKVADKHALSMSPDAFRQNRGEEKSAVLRMKLVGANLSAVVSGSGEQEGKSNYFIGNDPSQWQTNVSNYSQVRYEDAYPGVDLVYYGNQQQLEYDFVVAPGADAHSITLDVASEYAGQTSGSPRIAANGDLLVPTNGGEVRFHKPLVYQTNQFSDRHAIGGDPNVADARTSIDGRWVLKGGNRVGFEVAAYDATKPLVIDPALSYSSYLGGTGTDGAFGVAIDQYGNCYITGFTSSTNFPTKNPYQKKNAGGIDTFVTKLNPTGTALMYSTYLGGSGTEYPFALAVDSKGSAYEVGNTGSTNFPVTAGAYQTTCPSCALYPAVFITKFAPAGTSLLYSTYLGGTGDNRAFGVTLDSSDDIYIVGWTTSTDFPVSANAFQASYIPGAVSNAFVTEINPAAATVPAQLVYSTYLGGSVQDVGFGIALDSSNDAVVTGYTYSLNFPVTSGAFQTTTTTNGAAYVSKLDVNGTGALLYSTYLGGTTGTSAGNSVKLDSSGNVYVTGYTCASDFPTKNAFQSTFGGDCTPAGGDAFVTEINPAATEASEQLVYSTYLGGSGDDVGFSIGLDSSNNAYIVGRSSSTNFPTTPGAFQSAQAGSYNTIYSIVNPTGNALLYSTYIGGSSIDVAFVLAVDKLGNSYVIGRSYSPNFPVTPGSFQQTLRGTTNAIVYKFVPGDQAWPMALNFGTQTIGVTSAPLTTTLTNSGTATLSTSGATLTGTNASDYAISPSTSTCGPTLAAGASCVIGVTLTPSATGTRTANLVITDAAQNSPQVVTLTGIASDSSVSLTPGSLTFITQVVGTNSTSQAATLTNTGTVAVTITKIATTGPYSQTNNCPASLLAAATCTVNVVFTPTKGGTQTGTLSITDSAPNSPQSVALTGTGTVMSFSPSSLNFGTVTEKTSSPPQTITVTNVGTTTVAIASIKITGSRVTSFSETNNCPISPSTLAAGGKCTVNVVFTPQLKGALNADVTFVDAGGGSPQTVPLAGTGD
jgi:beta-propeller repeat-containing protein/HYDIN/CFA65/VesB family protein